MKSGTYAIVNTATGYQYIGSTKDFDNRRGEHFHALRSGKHINVWLQRSFDKHGKEAFDFIVLEECPEDQLFIVEKKMIEAARASGAKLYNIGAVGGGDNLTRHPNRKEIVERRSAKLRGAKRKPMYGETNSNWRGGVPRCSLCGKGLRHKAKRADEYICGGCRDRSGERNPFFGKAHSAATREALRHSRLGKKPTNARAIVVDGVQYLSMNDASKALGIKSATISHRVRSKSFANYHYA